jgi:hypothetical protein
VASQSLTAKIGFERGVGVFKNADGFVNTV